MRSKSTLSIKLAHLHNRYVPRSGQWRGSSISRPQRPYNPAWSSWSSQNWHTLGPFEREEHDGWQRAPSRDCDWFAKKAISKICGTLKWWTDDENTVQVVGRRNAAYNCGRDLVNVGNESLEDGESRWLNSDTVLYNWFPYLTLTRSQKLSRAAPRAFGIYVPQGIFRASEFSHWLSAKMFSSVFTCFWTLLR